MKKILTLCIIYEHPRVLLGMKKRGFGQGKWNGFGGKIKEGETIEAAAKRELQEEAGIEVKTLAEAGILDFEFEGNPEILEVHVFKGQDIMGEPLESEEMEPKWFHIDEIPFEDMWPDDKHWLPLLFGGKKFRGRFLFGEEDSILDMALQEVKEL
ncbi:MAG: 8-oxo-dGTP diphosphatase [Candidatus Wildermuthbacteria bacterium]|nr:8-oxo-dGTP diphosphatase [Candidatus Wildermuthbacteria bacterium]